MFRKILLTTASLVAISGTAFAADLPSRAAPPVFVPPPPIFTWSGAYVGAQIGYEWGTSSNSVFASPGAGVGLGSYSPNGVVGGAHIGYNYQISQFVVGLEGDVNGSSYRGNNAVFGGLGTVSTRSNVDGSIRGRVGVAWDRALIYATGGAAFGSIHDSFANGIGVDTESTTRVGWTVGGGVEYAVTNNWSVRAEYRYTDYGSTNFSLLNTSGGIFTMRSHDTDNRVQAGFSYKFDQPMMIAPPIVAKY
jgi:outer membrane immunogenic protein